MTLPFSRSPDRDDVAEITGDESRYPGRECRYGNGVDGECLLDFQCSEERQQASGYNSTWNCPEHADKDRGGRICCPFLGEGKLRAGKRKLHTGGGWTRTAFEQVCVCVFFPRSTFWFGLRDTSLHC